MKDIGSLGEALIARWLEIQNYELLQQNWRCRCGEIDIIARNEINNTVAFVEVKTRSRNNWDENGLLAVNSNKQQKIWKTASLFLAKYPQFAEFPCRFDVALVSYKCLSQSRQDAEKTKIDLKKMVQLDIGQCVIIGQYQLTIEDYLESAFDG